MNWKLLALLVLSSCGFGTKTIEELDPNAVPQIETQIDYETDIDPLMQFYCVSCHDIDGVAASEITLNTEDDLLAFCDDVIGQLFFQKAMPPGGARRLTSSELALLQRWMEFKHQDNLDVCSLVSELP